EQATVYRTKNGEGSGAWTSVLSDPGMSRTSLAVAPSDPSIVYALAASNRLGPRNTTQNLLAVYRSEQNGDPGAWTTQVRYDDADKLSRVLLTNAQPAIAPQCEGKDDSVTGDW